MLMHIRDLVESHIWYAHDTHVCVCDPLNIYYAWICSGVKHKITNSLQVSEPSLSLWFCFEINPRSSITYAMQMLLVKETPPAFLFILVKQSK